MFDNDNLNGISQHSFFLRLNADGFYLVQEQDADDEMFPDDFIWEWRIENSFGAEKNLLDRISSLKPDIGFHEINPDSPGADSLFEFPVFDDELARAVFGDRYGECGKVREEIANFQVVEAQRHLSWDEFEVWAEILNAKIYAILMMRQPWAEDSARRFNVLRTTEILCIYQKVMDECIGRLNYEIKQLEIEISMEGKTGGNVKISGEIGRPSRNPMKTWKEIFLRKAASDWHGKMLGVLNIGFRDAWDAMREMERIAKGRKYVFDYEVISYGSLPARYDILEDIQAMLSNFGYGGCPVVWKAARASGPTPWQNVYCLILRIPEREWGDLSYKPALPEGRGSWDECREAAASEISRKYNSRAD